ncbi:pre-mRNA cleavage complex II Clp1-like protein [Leishmania mexicana MHOM/GT/2001/U1103]|uniref:Pre-mRNA cleavage complex II Clp1-like protein n=1 Tax=Leishmania mexicana (strain MHOM/GT/2001/U1103) TaxID=929439 RepID=E9B114_LEIMU|nr:pre-mRNA cleavage complex II Clp1-like protein [Leishmania mexicana MHOM/GT/2001/U1103]CBZ28919.1 pre-mRNA cleavage complex II Clp1-like protein [Leishmania mexicana MHOM/GT/2001/U1103]
MQPRKTHTSLHLSHEAVTIQWNATQDGGSVLLVSGKVELFRSSLTRNLRYAFPAEACIVLEAFGDAVVQIEGDAVIVQTPISSVLDEIHALLDTARVDAMLAIDERGKKALSSTEELKDSWQGPRVLVVGENQWEREMVSRALLNLAVRGGSPYGICYVDVDVAMPMVGCPGTVSAAFVEEPVTAPEDFGVMMPLSFFHGTASVTSATLKRYLDLCVCAAQAATSLGFANSKFEAGGFLIHSLSPSTEIQYDVLSDILSIFAVTHVVITGADWELEKFLYNAVLGRTVHFVRLPKLAGVQSPSPAGAEQRRRAQLERYFFGTPRTPLMPMRGVARMSELVLLHAETFEPLSWREVPDLGVAAVVWADTAASAAEANVAGFVAFLEVGKQFVSFLAPSGGELPKPFLVVSPSLHLPRELVMPLPVT